MNIPSVLVAMVINCFFATLAFSDDDDHADVARLLFLLEGIAAFVWTLATIVPSVK